MVPGNRIKESKLYDLQRQQLGELTVLNGTRKSKVNNVVVGSLFDEEEPELEDEYMSFMAEIENDQPSLKTEEEEEGDWDYSKEEALEEEGKKKAFYSAVYGSKESEKSVMKKRHRKDQSTPAPPPPPPPPLITNEDTLFGAQSQPQSGTGFGSFPPAFGTLSSQSAPSASSPFGSVQGFGPPPAFGAPALSSVNIAYQFSSVSEKSETSGFSFGQTFGAPTQQMSTNNVFGGPVTKLQVPQQQMFGVTSGFGGGPPPISQMFQQTMRAGAVGGLQPPLSKKTHGSVVPEPPPSSRTPILRPSKFRAGLPPTPPPPLPMAAAPGGTPTPPLPPPTQMFIAASPGRAPHPPLRPWHIIGAPPKPLSIVHNLNMFSEKESRRQPSQSLEKAAILTQHSPPAPTTRTLESSDNAKQVSWRTMGRKLNQERESKQQEMEDKILLDSPQENLRQSFLKRSPERKQQEMGEEKLEKTMKKIKTKSLNRKQKKLTKEDISPAKEAEPLLIESPQEIQRLSFIERSPERKETVRYLSQN
ncbi:uncharacterized protein LOC133186285 [Saccostrea echinata]|uniref:uncharacterized protein LOC133186285 n=1 Tax=Saccostrea echinata TaxID=191078 RepID=UPI002A827069|nr:uncharacterized protein LOC133186285 [Saccostrea echinata]